MINDQAFLVYESVRSIDHTHAHLTARRPEIGSYGFSFVLARKAAPNVATKDRELACQNLTTDFVTNRDKTRLVKCHFFEYQAL